MILATIKTGVGVAPADTSFDEELLISINSVVSVLLQLGIISMEQMIIVNPTTEWSVLLGDRRDAEMVKSFMILKVKMIFDPPSSAAAIEALKQTTQELEWRITNISVINSAT